VADDSVDESGDQRMPGLDGDQPAKATPQDKDWPEAQRTTSGEESDAKPPNGICIEVPDLLPGRVGRQLGGQQPDDREGYEDPAVATFLALAGAQVSATEKRCTRHHQDCNRESNSGPVREEGCKTAPAEDSKAEIGKGAHHRKGH
jgi:hypothetical protein